MIVVEDREAVCSNANVERIPTRLDSIAPPCDNFAYIRAFYQVKVTRPSPSNRDLHTQEQTDNRASKPGKQENTTKSHTPPASEQINESIWATSVCDAGRVSMGKEIATVRRRSTRSAGLVEDSH